MNICIIGGGNMGTALAAYFYESYNDVVIYSKNAEKFCRSIEAIDIISDEKIIAEVFATNDLSKAVSTADIICITYPSFMLQEIFDDIAPLLRADTIVGVIPGTGGVEFFSKPLKNNTVFGLDRVPCVARIKEYGKAVYHSKKKSVRVAALPSSQTQKVCEVLNDMLDFEFSPLNNYLTLTFTPSNPTLHTSRTYTMFKDYVNGDFYDRKFLFYKEWTMDASEMLHGMDMEIHDTCDALDGIDLSGVIPILTHYESETPKQMTDKIRSIKSLSQIVSPMKEVDGGFIPDFSSRFFIEDFPYGLMILKGFAQIAGIKTPNMDKVIRWHGERLGQNYIDENGEILQDNDSITPQKYGINTVQDVYDFYLS